MVPAAAVDAVLTSLTPLLEPGDILIDGGNSYYHDDIRRAAELKQTGLHYVDVGVSGGVWGLERGYCQMIGGEPAIVQHLDPYLPRPCSRSGHGAAHGWGGRRANSGRARVICIAGRTAAVISSRWSIMGSNMALWPPIRKV